MANNLPTEKKVLAVSMLEEGSSIRAIEQITGVHRDTIVRLGVRVGEGCAKIQDEKIRNIQSADIQIDEIWGFIGKKKKQTRAWEGGGVGDVWTFIALDSDTKLIPAFRVGQRTMIQVKEFLQDLERVWKLRAPRSRRRKEADFSPEAHVSPPPHLGGYHFSNTLLAGRLANRIQLSSDGLAAYRETVAGVFGHDVDYGQLVKTYSVVNLNQSAAGRYSPAQVVKTEKTIVNGMPDVNRITTSHVEKQNHFTDALPSAYALDQCIQQET